MRALIVNADDFGLTRGVNRAVEEAHGNGILTATSVLVTAAHATAAGDTARRCPELDIGLHGNITFGSPASDASRVRSLVDREGRFLSEQRLLRRLMRREVDPRDVHRELGAQVGMLRSFGVEPSHWDAHRAVLFWPGLLRPAAAALQAAGVRRVRTPRIWVGGVGGRPRLRRWRWRLASPRRLLTDANRVAGAAVLARRFALPDWRVSANLVLGDGTYAERWRVAVTALPAGVTEAVTHPAHPDDELRRLTPAFSDVRGTDLQVLLDPDLKARLTAAGIRLTRFRELDR